MSMFVSNFNIIVNGDANANVSHSLHLRPSGHHVQLNVDGNANVTYVQVFTHTF